MKNTSINAKVLFLIVTLLALIQTALADSYNPNYTSENLTIISVDLLGTGLVGLKPFIPMIIIGFAVLILVTLIFKSLRKLDEV